MGTWLEGDIYGGVSEQMTVGIGYRGHGIDLGMPLAAASVVAFAYYASVMNDDGAHHGIGRGVRPAVTCKLDGAAHEGAVDFSLRLFHILIIIVNFAHYGRYYIT